MVNEEKILQILTSMKGDITSMKGEMATMQGDITSMQGDITSMQGDITSMKGEMAIMRDDITKINIKLETDIELKIDALGDGHASILEQLVPRTRVDDLENEVRFLKSVVFQMNEDIRLLKQAQ